MQQENLGHSCAHRVDQRGEKQQCLTLITIRVTKQGMIKSFRSKDTEALFQLEHVRQWAQIERIALRILVQLNLADSLGDMRAPPGNRIEALSGDRKGQWSIRINDQYRICFRWGAEGPEGVEIIDYH
jgi:toxin HigB-1